MKMSWPVCPEHGVKLVLRPNVQIGSPWACPTCGAIDTSQEAADAQP